MTANNLLIQPRMPRVVMAEDLLASQKAFVRLFPVADIVDFTEIPRGEQPGYVQKYLAWLDEVNQKKGWRREAFRYYERSRKDYYIAALCNGRLKKTEKLLTYDSWDPMFLKSALLIVSSETVSDPFFTLKLYRKFTMRYDYQLLKSLRFLNILVLPDRIVSSIKGVKRREIVHTFAKLMFLGTHDDLHGIEDGYFEEYQLRQIVAALFSKMPEDFRKTAVDMATQCLDSLNAMKPKPSQPSAKKQPAAHAPNSSSPKVISGFFQGALVYALQYLFDRNDPLLQPFIQKLTPHIFFKKLNMISEQLFKDREMRSHETHSLHGQAEALHDFKQNVNENFPANGDCPSPRLGIFLPTRMADGSTIHRPPTALRRSGKASGLAP